MCGVYASWRCYQRCYTPAASGLIAPQVFGKREIESTFLLCASTNGG